MLWVLAIYDSLMQLLLSRVSTIVYYRIGSSVWVLRVRLSDCHGRRLKSVTTMLFIAYQILRIIWHSFNTLGSPIGSVLSSDHWIINLEKFLDLRWNDFWTAMLSIYCSYCDKWFIENYTSKHTERSRYIIMSSPIRRHSLVCVVLFKLNIFIYKSCSAFEQLRQMYHQII